MQVERGGSGHNTGSKSSGSSCNIMCDGLGTVTVGCGSEIPTLGARTGGGSARNYSHQLLGSKHVLS
jgi:hypothetical protein